MRQFQINLKNEKVRLYDWFAIFLFIINGVAICIVLSKSDLQKLCEGIPGMLALVLAVLLLISLFINKNYKERKYVILFISLSITGFWIALRQWIPALLVPFLAFLYHVSKRDLVVMVSKNYIIYPSFPKRKIRWDELNNVILKDELLTLDLKNNRVYQHTIERKTQSLNQEEFNEFCQQQLNK